MPSFFFKYVPEIWLLSYHRSQEEAQIQVRWGSLLEDRQGDCEFKARLGNIVRHCLQNQNPNLAHPHNSTGTQHSPKQYTTLCPDTAQTKAIVLLSPFSHSNKKFHCL